MPDTQRSQALRALAAALMALAEEEHPGAASAGEQLLRYDQVAEVLAGDESFARRLGRKGLLPEVRIGGAVRVRRADLDEFIRRHRAARG